MPADSAGQPPTWPPSIVALFSRQGGIKALEDEPRSGRPPQIDEVDVVIATLASDGRPPAGNHALVGEVPGGRAGDLVRIGGPDLAQVGIQPHGIETFKFSTDPQLEPKIRDVVGLYLDPPHNAVVVSVDEKSRIQALDRTAPVLPLRTWIAAWAATGVRLRRRWLALLRLLATVLHQRLALPQVTIAALFSVRPETINKRIRDIRQLPDQAGHVIQPGPHRLASLDDLTSFASAQGITTPPEIKTAC